MIDNDATEAARKIVRGLSDKLTRMTSYRTAILKRRCESPIEVMFGAALWALWQLDEVIHHSMELADQGRSEPVLSTHLIPQYRTESGHRIDFVIIWRSPDDSYGRLGAECDGHDFHEKTKEQAARDKRRDRAIQMEGIPIFRFTGSEIYRDPVACAAEIIAAIDQEDDRRMAAIYSPEAGNGQDS